eukprot:Polyplicarium_translucidae@DN1418_c0_g1_i2.p1
MRKWLLLSVAAPILKIRAAEPSGEGLGRCHVYYPNDPATSCGHIATEAECNQPCGDSLANPCISTMFETWWGSPNCDTCYRVTLHNDKDESNCEDPVCEPFTRTVYLQIKDGNGGNAKFEMGQRRGGGR